MNGCQPSWRAAPWKATVRGVVSYGGSPEREGLGGRASARRGRSADRGPRASRATILPAGPRVLADEPGGILAHQDVGVDEGSAAESARDRRRRCGRTTTRRTSRTAPRSDPRRLVEGVRAARERPGRICATALQEAHPKAGLSKPVGHDRAAEPRPDDHDVVVALGLAFDGVVRGARPRRSRRSLRSCPGRRRVVVGWRSHRRGGLTNGVDPGWHLGTGHARDWPPRRCAG